MPVNRAKYQFLGNWPWEVIYGEYPMWRELVDGTNEAAMHGWQQITVTKEMLSNAKGKDYSDARLGTIKLNPIEHRIAIPEGKQVVRVVVHGFGNSSDNDAVLSAVNGQPCNYVFPKRGYNPIYTTHVLSNDELPMTNDQLSLTFSEAQCCVVIRVYVK